MWEPLIYHVSAPIQENKSWCETLPANTSEAITSNIFRAFFIRARLKQGCQIFLHTIYQKKDIPNYHQRTKCPYNVPNGRNLFQMDIAYSDIFHFRPIQNLPKLGFLVYHLATLDWREAKSCHFYFGVTVQGSGWPDWANGRWFVLGRYKKITEAAHIFGLLYSTLTFMR
jgi:hypothetical protein